MKNFNINWITLFLIGMSLFILCGFYRINTRESAPAKPKTAHEVKLEQWFDCLDACDAQWFIRDNLCEQGSDSNLFDCWDESGRLVDICYDKCNQTYPTVVDEYGRS